MLSFTCNFWHGTKRPQFTMLWLDFQFFDFVMICIQEKLCLKIWTLIFPWVSNMQPEILMMLVGSSHHAPSQPRHHQREQPLQPFYFSLLTEIFSALLSIGLVLDDFAQLYANVSVLSMFKVEEPGRLQSIGLHRVRQDWSSLACTQA